jgi:replication-associated recombination protein RarA
MEKEKFDFRTHGGYNFYDVTSAFQKCIRRGMEHEALYWGTELYLSNYHEYAWKRMIIMSSEDVGIAEENICSEIWAMYEMWVYLKKDKSSHAPERLPFVHAIMKLSRAMKSRMVDNKLCLYFDFRHRCEHEMIPDFALDMHTIEGKKKGRGIDHFYTEGGKINDENPRLVPEELKIRELIWKIEAAEHKPKNDNGGLDVEQTLFDGKKE